MEHGSKSSKGKARQVESNQPFTSEDFQLLYQPTAGTSGEPASANPREESDGERNESSHTTGSQNDTGSNQHSNIRPYVAEFDQLITGYRASERTRFEVISALTDQLNRDPDLTPQERSKSFELCMAEIDSVETQAKDEGK